MAGPRLSAAVTTQPSPSAELIFPSRGPCRMPVDRSLADHARDFASFIALEHRTLREEREFTLVLQECEAPRSEIDLASQCAADLMTILIWNIFELELARERCRGRRNLAPPQHGECSPLEYELTVCLAPEPWWQLPAQQRA